MLLLDGCVAREHKFARVVDEVCKTYSIDRSTLLGRRRHDGTAQARQVAIYLCARYHSSPEAGTTEVADFFRRDRTTVLWAIKSVEGLLSYDRKFKARVYAINTACSNPLNPPSLSPQ